VPIAAASELVDAQNELAFRKRWLRDAGADPEQDPIAAGWREKIRHLRAAG
jgi:hypothetical protein